MTRTYYNEHDPKAAAWLRELMRVGAIPGGVVDERSIVDVLADDLRGFTACHFFAGIGGWAYALRLAGWPDERPVWTGSCPCQPFSAAGRRKGEDDPRHLWPEFRRLIAECRPPVVFGEQVASQAGRRWLAGVRADLEGLAYAVGAADLCAAGVGAPHIRQRLYWVADADRERWRWRPETGGRQAWRDAPRDCSRVGDADRERQHGVGVQLRQRGPHEGLSETAGDGGPCGMGNASGSGKWGNGRAVPRVQTEGDRSRLSAWGLSDVHIDAGATSRLDDGQAARRVGRPASFWSAYDILSCLDGKARRIEPGTFPLAHGAPARVGRLRGYSNAIVPQVAATFIEAAGSC